MERKHNQKQSGGVESAQTGNTRRVASHYKNESNFCSLCGAWRGQLGLEPTPNFLSNTA